MPENLSAPTLAQQVEVISQEIKQRWPCIHSLHGYYQGDDLCLMLSVPWPTPYSVLSEIADIAAVAKRLPVKRIQINERGSWDVATLQAIEPEKFAESIDPGRYLDALTVNAMLQELVLSSYTLLMVSKAGVYLSVQHQGGEPLPGGLSLDEVIGHTCAEVIGKQAHGEIVEAVNTAIDTGKPQEIFIHAIIRSKPYRYWAKVTGLPSRTGGMLAVRLLDQSA
jgi:hypothetical protein